MVKEKNMEQDHPNWVKQYAKCDMRNLFATLYKHIKQDVEDRLQVVGERQESTGFRYAGDERTQILVTRSGPQGDKECQFTLNGNNVLIQMQDPDRDYTITTRWDEEAIQCKVVLTGVTPGPIERPHDQLWKIVHMILRPFLFPDPN